MADVNDVMVNTASGVSMPVRNVMVIQSQLGPSQIDRKNQERMVMVSAEPEIPLSEAVKAVTARLPEINRPQGFSIGFGAEVEQQEKTFNELRLVLILALILVYAVMASQYESLRDPFIIMFSVPTAAIGVVLALYLTEHVVQPAGLSRRHHARRHRRQQRDLAGGLHEHPSTPRRHGAA